MALAGGADLIDVKEPKRGSLGRAEDAILGGVLDTVAGRCPVSAAMGELRETSLPIGLNSISLPLSPPSQEGDRGSEIQIPLLSCQYLKWGLADCHPHRDWRGHLCRLRAFLEGHGTLALVVNVAYADWTLAQAPPVQKVVDFACEQAGGVLLIDTWDKTSGKTLLDWLSIKDLLFIRKTCRAAGVRLVLAGSLQEKQIAELLEVQPDWFAVRGAVCTGGRDSKLSVEKVRRLKQLLQTASPVARCES